MINGILRKVIPVLFDVLCFLFIDILYYLLASEAEFSTPVSDIGVYLINSAILLASVFVFQLIFSVYTNLWRYASTAEYLRIIVADCFGGLCALLIARLSGVYIGIWHAVTVASLTAQLSLVSRFVYRLIYKKLHTGSIEDKHYINAAISGADQLGAALANDLLFRQPLDINGREALEYYTGKTVLITGGGGSIGSELCRQIAKCNPKKLIVADCYENSAYEIEQEIRRNYGGDVDIAVEIASVRDRARLECIFKNYRPDVVFHAAAHKHVPLMEHSGCEAVKNNVLGTYNTADMAEKYGVKKFILISTDKAVNPTNIMGASKRLCEMIVQSRGDSSTCFAAVRFGNVLGSNGSVIPLFKRQIANGGPVTITDKRIIRYFMTIPEASQLVMHAGSMAKKGELFVLDMGRPVRIYDLAKNMIELSGYRPDIDIMIEEIGLRPGEKLYEELLIDPENLDKTDNNMIFVERDVPLSRREVDEKIAVLNKAADEACEDVGSEKIKAAFAKVVPTFHDPKEVNESAVYADEMKNSDLLT